MKRHASRSDSGFHQVKLRVPADVVERARGRVLNVDLPASVTDPACRIGLKLGAFCKGSLHTRDAATADVRRLLVVAALGKLCDALRRGPVALSHEQVVALSGEVYELLVDEHRANPGTESEWANWKALLRAAMLGKIPGAPPIPVSGRASVDDETVAGLFFGEGDLTAAIDALPAEYETRALHQRCGQLTFWALNRHGIEVDSEMHLRLLRAVARAALDAGWRLKRMAQDDYRPDPMAERFPKFEGTKARGLTLSGLFDRWKAEVKPTPSTVSTWRGVIRSLTAHLGQDIEVGKLDKANVIAWKDALVERGVRPKTVNDQHLASLKTLLNFAVRNGILTDNVAQGVRLQVKPKAGERMLPYGDDDVARLLNHASRETSPAKRWLPWLAVLTGARIGELAQMWGGQVTVREGVPVIEIRPAQDGGTLKNAGSERTVPLHPALVEAGFITFAKKMGDRPLFYSKPARRGAEAKHPSKGVSNHLATWIRTLPGFDDPRKAPAHAARHWFKTTGARLEIMDSLVNFIQGHTDASTAGTYRHFTVAQMAKAVGRFPVPSLARMNDPADREVEVTAPIVQPV